MKRVSIEILDDVSLIPTKARELVKRYNLNPTDFDIVRDVGINAGYLRFYRSRRDGEEIVCSPLHWDESPRIWTCFSRSMALLISLRRSEQCEPIRVFPPTK